MAIILPEKVMGLIIKLTCIAISSTAPKPTSPASLFKLIIQCSKLLDMYFDNQMQGQPVSVWECYWE